MPCGSTKSKWNCQGMTSSTPPTIGIHSANRRAMATFWERSRPVAATVPAWICQVELSRDFIASLRNVPISSPCGPVMSVVAAMSMTWRDFIVKRRSARELSVKNPISSLSFIRFCWAKARRWVGVPCSSAPATQYWLTIIVTCWRMCSR